MNILVTGSGTIFENNFKKLSINNNIIASYNKSFPSELKFKKNIKIKKLNLNRNINLKDEIDALVHCASLVPAHNPSKKNV